MNKTLIEFVLRTKNPQPGTAEVLRNIFRQQGYKESQLLELQRKNSLAVGVYVRPGKKAELLKRKLLGLRLDKVRLEVRPLRPREWQETWKDNIQPFRLTRRLDVVPVWHRKRYRESGRKPIFLDTTFAFGTGLHETTRFMAQLIERCRGTFLSFLDVGTGTGILTIVADKCGAKNLFAIDIDGGAVNVAKSNLQLNHIPQTAVRRQEFSRAKVTKRFDFVAANLVTDDLIRMRDKIVSVVTPGGWLAVSGISLANLRRLQGSFKKLPVRCFKVQKGRQWAAILYQRRKEKI